MLKDLLARDETLMNGTRLSAQNAFHQGSHNTRSHIQVSLQDNIRKAWLKD